MEVRIKRAALTLVLFVAPPALGQAELDLGAARGRGVMTFPSLGSATEYCLLSKAFPGVAPSVDDLKAEAELCSFFRKTPTASSTGLYYCPKVTSTSTGIDFIAHALGAPLTCDESKRGKRLTRFKLSEDLDSCTYAPGVLAYYHVSRALGGILDVPLAVLRTLDIKTIQPVVANALAQPKLPAPLRNNYTQLASDLAQPSSASHAAWIFTKDYDQVYGFLIRKVKDEGDYPGFEESLGQSDVERIPGLQDVFDARPLENILGGRKLDATSLGRLQGMRDFADLVVLDTILGQGDRYSGQNLTYRWVDLRATRRGFEVLKAPAEGSLRVRKMVAGDNDCSFINHNINAERGYVARIRHIHPTTYRKVQDLARLWRGDSRMKEHLIREFNFTEAYAAKFGKNLLAVAGELQGLCAQGLLRRDLDANHFFLDHPRGEPGC